MGEIISYLIRLQFRRPPPEGKHNLLVLIWRELSLHPRGFNQKSFKVENPHLVTAVLNRRYAEFLRSIEYERCVYLLLEENSRAAGIVKLFSDGSKIEIASIYILEEFRGRGFGRKALEYIFSEYKGFRIVLWVLEVNLNARAFYEKCGFELTDKVRQIDRGGEFKQLMYARSGS